MMSWNVTNHTRQLPPPAVPLPDSYPEDPEPHMYAGLTVSSLGLFLNTIAVAVIFG